MPTTHKKVNRSRKVIRKGKKMSTGGSRKLTNRTRKVAPRNKKVSRSRKVGGGRKGFGGKSKPHRTGIGRAQGVRVAKSLTPETETKLNIAQRYRKLVMGNPPHRSMSEIHRDILST
jgi:hypothetical protein